MVRLVFLLPIEISFHYSDENHSPKPETWICFTSHQTE